jgi:hypothetical protein
LGCGNRHDAHCTAQRPTILDDLTRPIPTPLPRRGGLLGVDHYGDPSAGSFASLLIGPNPLHARQLLPIRPRTYFVSLAACQLVQPVLAQHPTEAHDAGHRHELAARVDDAHQFGPVTHDTTAIDITRLLVVSDTSVLCVDNASEPRDLELVPVRWYLLAEHATHDEFKLDIAAAAADAFYDDDAAILPIADELLPQQLECRLLGHDGRRVARG